MTSKTKKAPVNEFGDYSALSRQPKAEPKLLTESECAKAGDAWLKAKPGRVERYGVVEASSGVIDGKCSLTTTNFHLLEVDAATGKVKYLGVSPARELLPARSSKTQADEDRLEPAGAR